MAKAKSNKRRSGSTGKQRQPSLPRRKGRARKTAPKRTTRNKKASLAEVIAVLKDVFSEVRAFRLAVDQHRVVCRQCVAEIGLTPDKTSSGGDSRPELKAGCEAEGDRGRRNFESGSSNPNRVPGSIPDAPPRSHTNSGNCEPPTEAAIKDAHKLAFNAGLAKRAHRPLDILVQFYQHSREGTNTHTRKQLEGVPESSGHLIGTLLHQMGEIGLLEPAEPPIPMTEAMKHIKRRREPVRSWKLTDLGKAVAAYELKGREQAAAEHPASANTHDANSSVTAAADTK